MERAPIQISAKIISSVFSPLMMPTYGIILALSLTILHLVPLTTRLGIIALVMLMTAIIPSAVIRSLSMYKIIKNFALTERTDRLIPYIVTLLLYIATAIYLYMANAPSWVYGFMIGASVTIAITAIVNHWWKISAHSAAAGGLVAFSFVIATLPTASQSLLWLLITAILCAGLIGSSRLILNRHTPAQVYLGFLNGLINVFLWSSI